MILAPRPLQAPARQAQLSSRRAGAPSVAPAARPVLQPVRQARQLSLDLQRRP